MVFHKLKSFVSLTLLSTSAFFLSRTVKSQETDKAGSEIQTGIPKIAVIGGGIGGTSCAYFLQELFRDGAEIDVYERGEIGGRIKSIHIAGRDYESGASIIHPRNKYLVQHAAKFGLKHRKKISSLMGAYNGREFVFEESQWGIITVLKMILQYGFMDLWGLRREVNSMLNKFDNIYKLQDEGQSFLTLRDMMHAMGGDDFVKWTMLPADQMLREMKFSEKFISEVVSLATRVNYGQDPDMEGFAASVSLAGVQSGLWAVEGGNMLLPENFLTQSKATRRSSSVVRVALGQNSDNVTKPSFMVTHTDGNRSETDRYDMVVIATPLVPGISEIEFVDFPSPIGPFPGEYCSTVATFIDGTLNPKAFGRTKEEGLPDSVITTQDIPLGIRSVAKNFPVTIEGDVDKDKFVYKIFSTEKVSGSQLDALFSSRSEERSEDWLAYPYYKDVDIDKVASFQLHDGIFHVSPIEWAASAMEMSVIGGKNVALLAKQYWNGLTEENGRTGIAKDEL
ncbi:prenylcysteine oxidase 1-like [Apostichopus japonicus]|uniref:prenylcysteine oxidase 1-like n=1 Tax=Stichopus japonicus TaxID=307972 RepID=UPI003AB47D07